VLGDVVVRVPPHWADDPEATVNPAGRISLKAMPVVSQTSSDW
jgi:hypothetical protein